MSDEVSGEGAPHTPTPWMRRRIRRWVIGAAVSTAILGGVVRLLFRRRSS